MLGTGTPIVIPEPFGLANDPRCLTNTCGQDQTKKKPANKAGVDSPKCLEFPSRLNTPDLATGAILEV